MKPSMLKRLRDKARQVTQTGGGKAGKTADKRGTDAAVTSGQASSSSLQNSPTLDGFDRDRADFADSTPQTSLDGRPGGFRSSLPDFMTDPNAVLEDDIAWRNKKPPDYRTAHRKYLRERTNIWPPGSLEDLVTNLIKNWKKEASHKARLEDWRTINPDVYRFSCNGSRTYTAEEMMHVGTSNALIQEAAFYSAQNTSFEDSHTIFQHAMPSGFSWEVTEVYSGPPVMAFKWRHWGHMTGKLVCPIGPETTLEAEPTGQEVEVWGICIAHLDPDFRITKLEVFYDPHELMASLVDANNLSYRGQDGKTAVPHWSQGSSLEHGLSESAGGEDGFTASRGSLPEDLTDVLKNLGGDPSLMNQALAYDSLGLAADPDSLGAKSGVSSVLHSQPSPALARATADSPPPRGPREAGIANAAAGRVAEKSRSPPPWTPAMSKADLPSDFALLSALIDSPKRPPPGSRCPIPH